MSKANPARRTSIVWWILAPVFFLITVVAFYSDIGDAAFALAFLSLVMSITAVIVAVIYWSRARKLDSILAGEGLLAHWTYSPEEWRLYTEKEAQIEKSMKKRLFFTISAFAIIIGIIFWVIDHESGIWVLAVMLGLIAIIGFVAWFTTWYDHRQNLKCRQGEVYISNDGIYLNKQLHLWNQLGARLGSVVYVDETPPSIVFVYYSPTRTGEEEREVRVPVPHGQETKAMEVLEKLT